MSAPTPATPCPHCGEPLDLAVVARARAAHRLQFAIQPKDGDRLSADTIGGTLVQMAKFIRSLGKDLGVKTIVLVDRITTGEDGAITVELIIANAPGKP